MNTFWTGKAKHMKRFTGFGITILLVYYGFVFLAPRHARAQPSLQVTYGNQGLQQITYNGSVLEDLSTSPSDAFHIWHMKMTDLSGATLSTGQFGWGENNNGRSWDASSNAWLYPFTWGSIRVQFVQSGDTLNINVSETNLPNSGVILDGAVIYPLALHFPQLPVGFNDASYPQLAYNTTGPSATLANFGQGEVAVVVPDATKPLYSGFQPTGANLAYTAIVSGTAPDGLATFQPHNDRPVAPGQTDSFTVSLRFAPAGTALSGMAADAYRSWAATWPPSLNWTDRRVIGTAYLASSGQGNVNQPVGFPNNPRRYFNDSNSSDFDVRTASGLSAFQARVLQQAQANVTNLRLLNAQGVITWDIEGEQYPQDTSYVCSPDQIAQAAPEMESLVTDQASPYAGLKLDDAYFKTMRDAGFRVGVCIRPQHFATNGDGTASQTYLPDAAVEAEMLGKMQYAHDRWGATLFYIDSTVESDGAVLDASIFQQAAAALPDSLLIPEESTPKDYAYVAPFQTFLFHLDLGTDPTVYSYYPKAFSANLINDVDAGVLAQYRSQLTQSIRNGDILMAHADYWQANNSTIVQMYADAGAGQVPSPAPTPVPTPVPVPVPVPVSPASASVVIALPTAGAIVSGSLTVQAQVNVPLDAAGSYLIADGLEVGTQRLTSGPFNYVLDTSTLANGAHTLQVWAHDVGNNTSLSTPVSITVANISTPPAVPPAPSGPVTGPGTPIGLIYPLADQALAGIVQVAGNISQALDSAGSYLLVDGGEWGTARVGSAPYLYSLDTSMLSVGIHNLQLWAHDINNDTLLSNIIQVQVTR